MTEQGKFDVIVIGLGAMGAATTYQLARSGVKVLGIDQYSPPHIYGSSHGETRITRQAIAEGKEYVPLVLRANEIWKEIEQEVGVKLYNQTGILIMASNTQDKLNKFVDDTIEAAKDYDIKHSQLAADEISKRFPQFNISGDEKGYFEDGAGFLRAEECISAQLELAKKHGAKLHTGEKMLTFKQLDNAIQVATDGGEYLTDKLVLTVGPWVQKYLPEDHKNLVKIYRQVLYWFEIDGDSTQYSPDKFPVFNWEFNTVHEDFMYGFPSLDGKSIKVATEQYLTTTHPDDVNRNVSQAEIAAMHEEYIEPHLRGVSANCVRAEACLYSATPDWRFLVDYLPDNPNVVIASPCSGHGFKHSAAIGEVISEMVQSARPRIDISAFGFSSLNL